MVTSINCILAKVIQVIAKKNWYGLVQKEIIYFVQKTFCEGATTTSIN